MLDRFSDGREQGFRAMTASWSAMAATPLFQSGDAGNAIQTDADAARWREAGAHWVGGNLKGLASKIGYLQRLGVTAIWISPVFRQVPYQDTYHGYGIQNFLDVDPHFGTRQDLKDLVQHRSRHGIYVILDIILNHSGMSLAMTPTATGPGSRRRQWVFRPALGWQPLPCGWLPRLRRSAQPAFWAGRFEQNTACLAGERCGRTNFNRPDIFTAQRAHQQLGLRPEYLEGDFFDLKDIHLGSGDIDHYVPPPAFWALCQVYKFWIAYADIDGFRVDTVKHMDPGAARFFSSVIHEFTAENRQGKLLPDWRDHRRATERPSTPWKPPAWTPPWVSTISPTGWNTWSRATATRPNTSTCSATHCWCRKIPTSGFATR